MIGRALATWAPPLAAFALFGVAAADVAGDVLAPEALVVLGVTIWMGAWWIAEVVPIAATSMLPLIVFPIAGVASASAIAAAYMDKFIVLMMAGFMAALAIERAGLHRRVALAILARVGASPRRLVWGMMLATALCSMWISNTAAALIMLPIGLALLDRLATAPGDRDEDAYRGFGAILFLGVAYGASIGGVATPIGTPPNMILLGQLERMGGVAPTFAEWMGHTLPLVLVGLPLVYLYLTRATGRVPDALPAGSREMLRDELRGLGSMRPDERAVAGIFGAMVVLWITRQIQIGDALVGWAPLLGVEDSVHDSTVAVFGAFAMFAWPSRDHPGERLLDWETAKRIPWDVVLLFGGGIALAVAFASSGLSETIAGGLTGLATVPEPLMILSIALAVTFLTEVTSNTATTTILLPLLASFAASSGMDPMTLMFPAALSASCAFMLPVATPPNAIVFGTGKIPIGTMARVGVWVNLGGAVVITLLVWALH